MSVGLVASVSERRTQKGRPWFRECRVECIRSVLCRHNYLCECARKCDLSYCCECVSVSAYVCAIEEQQERTSVTRRGIERRRRSGATSGNGGATLGKYYSICDSKKCVIVTYGNKRFVIVTYDNNRYVTRQKNDDENGWSTRALKPGICDAMFPNAKGT